MKKQYKQISFNTSFERLRKGLLFTGLLLGSIGASMAQCAFPATQYGTAVGPNPGDSVSVIMCSYGGEYTTQNKQRL